MNADEYLQSRVNDQINWMEGKSKYNQKMYKLLKLLEIVAAAAVPFLVNFRKDSQEVTIIAGALGVLIVVLQGVHQIYRYHQNWLTYRTTIETLKREKFLFETQTEPYNTMDAYKRFVQNIEALLADENQKWRTNWQKETGTETKI